MNHPEHICRFNDAPQTCECYDAGYKQALAEERKRVVMEIRKRMPSHDAVMEYLSSLDKPKE